MALKTAIKGAIVPVEEITSSFTETPDILDQLTTQGIISPKEAGAKFEFMKDFDFEAFKPVTKPTIAGEGAADIFDFIKKATGVETKPVTGAAPEVKAFKGEQEAALEAEKMKAFAEIDTKRDQEIQSIEREAEASIGIAKNQLAAMGILGTSTAATQYLTDIGLRVNELKSETRTKYEIQKMDIDAKKKQALLDAVDARILSINKSIQQQIENAQETTKLGISLFKELNEVEQTRIKNELETEKLRITEEYNEGRLEVDEYNAKINAIEAEINAYEAETARMKEARLAGAGRPTYSEFLNALGTKMQMTLDPNDPEFQAMYLQAFPMTVKEARDKLTTEQQARSEVVQDMIDKKEISLEEAMQVHPDVAWILHRPGLSSFERLFYGFSGGGIPTGGESEE